MCSSWSPSYANLLPVGWESQVELWMREDTPSFDYAGYVVGAKQDTAILWCKQSGVLCGRPFVDFIFRALNCNVTWIVEEGTFVEAQTRRKACVRTALIASVTGPANRILQGERIALNLMARASGIATLARRLRDLADQHQFRGSIAGTRKTTPGFRLVEKYALIVGGCDPHRYDLSSMIMLKDNHIWSSGSITAAVSRARHVGGFALQIEVECQSMDEAEEASRAGATVVMLDNFTPQQLKATAAELKQKYPHVIIEGSGGITEDSIINYFSDHVDVLSMGALTQGVPHVDFSLKIQPQK